MGGYTVGYTFFLREVALLMGRVLSHANVPHVESSNEKELNKEKKRNIKEIITSK